MEIWKVIVLFSSALIGGLTVFLSKQISANGLKLILSFSGAYLFAITVLHLIPEVYIGGSASMGLYILGGFVFQIVLEQFSEGIEHGHIHIHSHAQKTFPIGVMLSLCIHAFFEGIPLVSASGNELVFGIALHHLPAAFALATVLLHHAITGYRLVSYLALFAFMSPLGYWAGTQAQAASIDAWIQPIMAVVIGMFLHISTTILFESSVDHRFNFKKMLAVLLGLAGAILGFASSL
jgi:zinc and cadmium transporter